MTRDSVGDTPVSRKSRDVKPSMKAMPGTVPPLTSLCLVWFRNGYVVGLQTKMPAIPAAPLSRFQNLRGYCWYATGAGKKTLCNIDTLPSQRADPQAMAHPDSG